MDKRILLKQEFNSPKTTRFFGYIFLASTLVSMINMPIFGLILALVFSYISFSKTSNKINLEFNTISHKDLPRKNFPMGKYTHLSLLSANMSKSTFSRGNRETKDLYKEFRIVLLNESHTKKIVLEIHDEKDFAIERMEELSEVLKREVVKYNPQIKSRMNGRR
jgi:hypothetical protein